MRRARAIPELVDAKIEQILKPATKVESASLDLEQVPQHEFGRPTFTSSGRTHAGEKFVIRSAA
jgi:hypothetical protein